MNHDQLWIERAGAQHLDALIAFNKAMAIETEAVSLNPAVLASGVAAVLNDSDKGMYFIAYAGDPNCTDQAVVAGALMITFEWSDWRNGRFWWIQSVYVIPQRRRMGVYRSLHDHVRRMAQADEQACGIRLYVERDNTVAQETYENLDMYETHYRMYEEVF